MPLAEGKAQALTGAGGFEQTERREATHQPDREVPFRCSLAWADQGAQS